MYIQDYISGQEQCIVSNNVLTSLACIKIIYQKIKIKIDKSLLCFLSNWRTLWVLSNNLCGI